MKHNHPPGRAESAAHDPDVSARGASGSMTDLHWSIVAALGGGIVTDAADLGQVLGVAPRDVQAALRDLDDMGYVRLHEGQGVYSLRAKAKGGG